MSNFSDFYGGGVKSVQRGVATPPSPAEFSVTVAAVNPAKSMLHLLSVNTIVSGGAGVNMCVVRLIDSTTVGVLAYGNNTFSLPISWELIEFA